VKKNEKTSLHYAPDALGSGDFLATELRKIFFKVIQKILSYIPSTRKVRPKSLEESNVVIGRRA
jgi:hypothetical protein